MPHGPNEFRIFFSSLFHLVEFTKVGEIHIFLVDLLKLSNAKVLHMETKQKGYPKSYRASIQHGGSINCNSGNTRCHHYKEM
jgi:hypothetical protein